MVADDRGQLILVGAIAIALILLGLVLIVNTALFTQVVGSEGTVETAKDGGVSGQEVGDGLAALVADENARADPSDDYDDIDIAVNASSPPLESALRNRSIESSGSFVSLEYLGRTPAGEGTRIAQEDVATFEDATRAENASWDVIGSSSEVGGFSMVIHTDRSPLNNDFEVEIDGSDGDTTRVTVSRNGSNVDVKVTDSTSASCLDISPTNDTIHLDISNGRVYEDGQCQFDAFEPLQPGYTIRYEHGDDVRGTYELVTPDRDPDSDRRFGTGSGEPTATNAVWAFEYRYEYDSNAATVESDRREVEVYD